MQEGYLLQIERELPFSTRQMFLQSGEIRGTNHLRSVGRLLFDDALEALHAPVEAVAGNGAGKMRPHSSPAEVRRQLLPAGRRRTIFFAGKGGVGKTVASCITAVWLARQGLRTLLLTTDPAAHLGDVLGCRSMIR